jgi:N-acetyl-1-D-myo-inositol-2-amino-2-deoxy-alpha-D-glucopyranoside deacetylase
MVQMAEAQKTLMAVHAHPDDEVFGTGGILARYSREGVQTVLVTATRGEVGEIVDPTLDDAGREAIRRELGKVREKELRESVSILGVKELRFLEFQDSGMVGTAENKNPHSFYQANFDEAVKRLVKLIREFKPQVIVTYNEWGGYGHPDHVQAHRVTLAAFLAADEARFYPDLELPVWKPSKLYYTLVPKSLFAQAAEMGRKLGIDGPWNNPGFDMASIMGDPDERITTKIDAREYFNLKKMALAAHRTQIAPDNFMFKMPDEMMREGMGIENFQLFSGTPHPNPETGYEDDMFAGI